MLCSFSSYSCYVLLLRVLLYSYCVEWLCKWIGHTLGITPGIAHVIHFIQFLCIAVYVILANSVKMLCHLLPVVLCLTGEWALPLNDIIIFISLVTVNNCNNTSYPHMHTHTRMTNSWLKRLYMLTLSLLSSHISSWELILNSR